MTINPWRIGALCALVFGLLWGALALHDAWVSKDAASLERVAERDKRIRERDATIKARNRRIGLLEARDAESQKREQAQIAAHKRDSVELESIRSSLARETRDLISTPEVKAMALKYETSLASCEALSSTRAQRIATLEEQIGEHVANAADFVTNRAAADSNRVDLVAVYNPPWYRRTLGWIATRAEGAVIGGTVVLIAVKR